MIMCCIAPYILILCYYGIDIQLNYITGPSCGHILTYKTIPISIVCPQPKLHLEVLNIILMYGKAYMGSNTIHLLA